MKLLIVESPSKAKTILKYLGSEYNVLASYGHVRDLPSKNGSVEPDQDFAMHWELNEKASRALKEIETALAKADELYLATDPDREGEAIAWHIRDIIASKKKLANKPVRRVVFHEITKRAVQEALKDPRDIDQHLVDAYLARRALDYLVGFTISPLLWRRLPGARSAGRVQSVALRLVVDRELEIEAFKIEEYWSIKGLFGADDKKLWAKLIRYEGSKLDKFDIPNQDIADKMVGRLQGLPYRISDISTNEVLRHPKPPFTTSTLQQEGARKLGFSATHTMRIAQRLYEGVEVDGETVGLITYMRTDSTNMGNEALTNCRDMISKEFGAPYLPNAPRVYRSKIKNAQEAHEAIRPTEFTRHPDTLKNILDKDMLGLYTLVWKRAVSSQMESARLDRTEILIAAHSEETHFKAVGSVIKFDGFLKLYEEGRDDEAEDDEGGQRLPLLTSGENMALKEVVPEQHFTQPPARYSEATLVKKLEELGIGRPSTYASILHVLQERQYVTLEKKRFSPQEMGRLLVAFLLKYFPKYVEYDFTAHLEEELDDISMGTLAWKKALKDFWTNFSHEVDAIEHIKTGDVLTALNDEYEHFFFRHQSRECPACKVGKLTLKVGKFGAFLGCDKYPDCRYVTSLTLKEGGDEDSAGTSEFPKSLGAHPTSKQDISVRKGPYGPYIQEEQTPKPIRVSLPKGVDPHEVTLETALFLLSLPKDLGQNDKGQELSLGIGRYGPYIKVDKTFVSVKSLDDFFHMTLERACEMLEEGSKEKSDKPARRPRAKKKA